jgi:hypothetical protein
MEKLFKYKLDFYYQQAIIYLITLILYTGLKGSFIEDKFSLIFHDPIIYIIAFFVIFSFAVLLLNWIRGRKLIIKDDSLVFHNKFHEREIKFSNIEWMHIGRERAVQTAGRSQVIVFKIKGRRRLLRLRIGRYELQKELIQMVHEISKKVPQRKRWQDFIKKITQE